jgi:hypothetical protein
LYDRLYGLVVRGPGYRSRGPGFDYRVWNWVYSLVRITEELLE